MALRGRSGRFVKNPIIFGGFYDSLTPTLTAFPGEYAAEVNAEMRTFAQELEDYMKANAPWEDRSGDARDGLTAAVKESPTAPEILLYHTVSYGLWLEVRWNGKYAIILPTMESHGHLLMERIGEIL